jgi:hypothetical protein
MSGTTNLARGRTTAHRLADQTNFTTEATASFFELNAYSSTFTKKKPLDDDDVLGQAGYANVTDARPAAPGVEDADGSMSVPLDLMQIGYWLKGLLGAPVVTAVADPAPTGTNSFVFSSGAVSLPCRTIEKQLAATQFEAMIGAIVKDASFPIAADKGYAAVDMSLVGRQVTDPYTATIAGAPTVVALANRIPKSSGVIKIGGNVISRITTGSMKITNTVTTDRYAGSSLQSDAFLEKIDGMFDLTARYVDDTLRAYGVAGTNGFLPNPVTVELDYSLGTYLSLSIVASAVRFEPVSVPTSNGGLMTQKLSGRCEVGAAGPMITATLVNTQVAY